MTTIAVRDGIMAADSRTTYESEAGGTRTSACEKLYRKMVGAGRKRHEVIIGLAGDVSPALIFIDWYGSDKPPPQVLSDIDNDFTALILSKHGIFEADRFCRPERVIVPFWAIGSGCKSALAAMHMGASAHKAVSIACRIDLYTAPPIRSMALKERKK